MREQLSQILQFVIVPALGLLPAKMDTPVARVQLLAMGLQETRFETRLQVGGPAHGFWQGEKGGSITGVLRSAATKAYAEALCRARNVPPAPASVYWSMTEDDVLAAGIARLTLYADPAPLPTLGDAAAAWDCYLRNWRPGKPRPDTWAEYYAQALEVVEGEIHARA